MFGARWKAPLARALGVSRETVSRRIGSGDIPDWARNTVALLNANKGSVLSLCDRAGNMVRPWANAGFECFCIDSKHAAGDETHNGVTWIGADIRDWFPPPRRHAIVFAAPPCTNPPSAARVGSRTKRKSPSRGLNRESFKFRTIQRFIIAILALVTTPASTVRAQTRTTLKGNACPSETGRGILRDQSSNRRTVSTRSLANSRSTSSRVSHVSGSSQPGPANRAKKGSESRRKAEK